MDLRDATTDPTLDTADRRDADLSEAEHRYGALVRGSSDGVIIHDGTLIVFANAAARRLAGTNNLADPVGMRIDAFVQDQDSRRLHDVSLAMAADPKSEHRVTLHLRRLSGDVLPVEASVATVSWNGHQAFQVVLHDLRTQPLIAHVGYQHGQPESVHGDDELVSDTGALRRSSDTPVDSGRWPDVASFVTELREGLQTGALHASFQPIVELRTGLLRKVEALARWDHPRRGTIMPAEFIPLAERSGLIAELGEHILLQSCTDVVRMGEQGIDVGLSVNLSAMQLLHSDIAGRIAGVLERTGLAAAQLWIEVTESVLVDDEALLPLHELRDLGAHLVIDDFGTGFATFQYLTRLPVDALKIDTTFVAGLGKSANDTAIVRSVIGLGRELGLEIVAEGVETESHRAQLLALHCRLGQGWLFGPAMRYEVFVAAFRRTSEEEQPNPAASWDAHERVRLAALRASRILDTAPESSFDSIVHLASHVLSAPMALISLVDADRQWFKAKVGVEIGETARNISFCDHALRDPNRPLIVPDAALNDRFAYSPLVTGPLGIRAYAGVPILSREGLPIGALCVMDTQPRRFTEVEVRHLTMLSEQAGELIDLRRRTSELSDMNQRAAALRLVSESPPDTELMIAPTHE